VNSIKNEALLGVTETTIDDCFAGTGGGGNEPPCATGNGD
jgi:hypothetical protein